MNTSMHRNGWISPPRMKERTPISNSKIQRSASVSDIPLDQRSNRDATLKKRGANQPFGISNHRVTEDAENHDPNLSTPLLHKTKLGKGTNKIQESDGHELAPKLRSTLSARNLFSGTDLLSKVSEYCNELKKLATRTHDRESAENVGENVVIVNDKEKERKPLLEKSEVVEMGISSKGRLRRKWFQEEKMLQKKKLDLWIFSGSSLALYQLKSPSHHYSTHKFAQIIILSFFPFFHQCVELPCCEGRNY